MVSLTPVTDPNLVQQLEAAPSPPIASAPIPPSGMTPVDARTAKLLDSMGLPWYSRLGQGLADPVLGAEQFAAHALPQGIANAADTVERGLDTVAGWFGAPAPTQTSALSPPQLDQFVAKREADYQAQRQAAGQGGTDWWRLGGNVAATAPLSYLVPGAAAASLPVRMASGAASGALSNALSNPVVDGGGDYWSSLGGRAATGAAFGSIAPAAMGALSRVVRPDTSPEVQMLMDAGVRPTPGQIAGGTLNRLEQAATSVPGAGDFIKNSRRGAVLQFNRAAINQALAPIGESLETPGVGREAIAEMQDKIGSAYDQLVPQMGIPAVANGAPSMAAAQLNGDLRKILDASAFMPPERAAQLKSALQSQIYDRMSPSGGMTGQSFQDAKSGLGKLASDYLNSTSADERQLGGAFLQAQVALRDALRTANPNIAEQLSAADNAFAQGLRINNAATRLGGEAGAFSPAQLQAATKALDPTLRKRAFAAGDALMQDFAEAGKTVLGNAVPDSGTPYRHAAELGIAAVAGHGLGMPPEYALGAGALTGLTGLAYSPLGRAALAHFLVTRPALAAPLASGLRLAAPAASAAASPVFGGMGLAP